MQNERNALESSGNQPLTHPWKSCLPGNRSLVPKMLGMAASENHGVMTIIKTQEDLDHTS